MAEGNGHHIWRWVLTIALGVIGTLLLVFATTVRHDINELRDGLSLSREREAESKQQRADIERRLQRLEQR